MNQVESLIAEMTEMKSEMAELKTIIQTEMKSEMAELKTKIQVLEKYNTHTIILYLFLSNLSYLIKSQISNFNWQNK